MKKLIKNYIVGLNALISLDLKNNSPQTKEAFEQEMVKKEWSKISEVRDTWVSSFNEGVQRDQALNVIQEDIKNILDKLKMDKISLAVQLAPEDIVFGEFN